MKFQSASLAATVTLAMALVVAGCNSSGDSPAAADRVGSPVSAGLLHSLRVIGKKGLGQKLPSQEGILQRIPGPALEEKKPVVLYIGADYCPYCAAVRWPLVLALLRFGTFEKLRYMRSSSGDAYPDTATFSFHNAQYHSDYLAFEAVDIADRTGQPLNRPNDVQLGVFQQFDAAPYTRTPGAIPFLYIGGRYLEVGASFTPESLHGLSWRQVVAKLQQGAPAVTRPIMGAANVYTASFCNLTEQKPSNVCSAPAIKEAGRYLPQ